MDKEIESKVTYAIVSDTKARSELMAIHAQFIAERDIILITPEEYVKMQDDGILEGLPKMVIEEVKLYAFRMEDYNFTEAFSTAQDVRPQRQAVQSSYGKNYYKQNRFKPGYIHKQRQRPRHGRKD